MSTPKRIQRKRTKGWRISEGAVYVGRPTKWGNPYLVSRIRDVCTQLGEPFVEYEARSDVVHAFRSAVTYGPDSPHWQFGPHANILVICAGLNAGELRGKDLACWCPLDQPCHADVLLDLANREADR